MESIELPTVRALHSIRLAAVHLGPVPKVIHHIVTHEIIFKVGHRSDLTYTNMFVMNCLLQSHPLNLPILILYTIASALRHSMACLLYDHLITRLLGALRVDSGIEATMIIPRDYGFYTIDTLPHIGLTIYQDSYEHTRRDRPTSSQ